MEASVSFGDIVTLPLPAGESGQAIINPERGFDVGAGPNKTVEAKVEGGLSGIIIDCRGRPLVLPADDKKRMENLRKWAGQLNAYPA